jgi:hypothetical protein
MLGATACVVGLIAGCSSRSNPDTDGSDQGDAQAVSDAKSVVDVKKDTNSTMDGGPICPVPKDVSTFKAPTLSDPLGKHLNKCTDPQLTQYHDCVINKNKSACQAIQQMAMTTFRDCLQCLEGSSKYTGDTWGPLVCVDSMTCYLNVEGCVNLATGMTGMNSCGQLLHSSYECQRFACEQQCADDADGFRKCVQSALQGGCKKFGDAFSMTCGNLNTSDGGDGGYPELDNCFRRQGEQDSNGVRAHMDAYFCGP